MRSTRVVLTYPIIWAWIVSLSLSPVFGLRLYSLLFCFFVWLLERRVFYEVLKRLHPSFLPFLDAIGYSGADIPRRMALHHLADLMYRSYKRRTRRLLLRSALLRNTGRIITFASGQIMTQEAAVYVFAHDTTTRFVTEYVKKDTGILLIGEHRKFRKPGQDFVGNERTLLFTKDLVEGRKRLSSGQPLFILGDGTYGNQSISMPLCDHPRDFRTGFALMAVTARVAAIPVMTMLQPDGRIRVEVGEAFSTPSAPTTAEKLASYVAQYADVLTNHYRTNPEVIQSPYMTNFVRLVSGSHTPPDPIR
jgi:hypothetical protein